MAQTKRPGAPNPAENAKGVPIVIERLIERLDILKKQGITQAKVEVMIGAGPKYLSNVLAGRNKGVGKNYLPKIAAAVNCSIGYLTGESEDVGAPPAPPQVATPPRMSTKRLLGRGFVDDGAWRPVSRHTPVPVPGLGPLPDFDPNAQSVYIRVAPDNASQEVVVTISPEEYDAKRGALVAGQTVIVERKATIDGQECRQFVTRTVRADGTLDLSMGNEEVVAVVAYEARFRFV